MELVGKNKRKLKGSKFIISDEFKQPQETGLWKERLIEEAVEISDKDDNYEEYRIRDRLKELYGY